MPKVEKVWMPKYICNSMIEPVHLAGKDIGYYGLNQQFELNENLEIKENEIILLVNYFGLFTGLINQLISKYGKESVVVDCSQAFFDSPFDCVATIYSPRKFLGIPDGGILVTSLNIDLPKKQDEASIKRMEHLITRIAYSAETGYDQYKEAESTFSRNEPLCMSKLTMHILSRINFNEIINARRNNFLYLHEAIGEFNLFQFDAHINAPLCYPLMTKYPIPNDLFLENKIYTAKYWSDVSERITEASFEYKLVHNLTPLPIDQRYDYRDLNRVIDVVKKGLKK
jgi:hypothetical protein